MKTFADYQVERKISKFWPSGNRNILLSSAGDLVSKISQPMFSVRLRH